VSSNPIVDPSDLAVYLNDPGIDESRATMAIDDAQTLCETIVAAPLPDAAAVVVKRVAGRAYVTTLSPRQAVAAAAGGQFMGQQAGGVYLTRGDRADLRRIAGGSSSGAFTVNMLPSDYGAVLPPWDFNAIDPVTE
jgi:hypothetical protein